MTAVGLTETAARASFVDYDRAFEEEKAHVYPAIDLFEQLYGYALDEGRLLSAARVLACPLKVNPPNWQHGRLIYTLLRSYMAEYHGPAVVLDIGTAKGFSALCALWALMDDGKGGKVASVDVINPFEYAFRNSVLEVGGPKVLADYLAPWPESRLISFYCSTGADWIMGFSHRINFAFVDGKHSFEQVSLEASLLSKRQSAGDAILFDDVQIQGVAKAVDRLAGYRVEMISLNERRRYALAVKA